MKIRKSYLDRIEEIRSEALEEIAVVMKVKKRAEPQSLYLGEYQADLGGYPNISEIIWSDGVFLIDEEDEAHPLEDYTLEEIICVLDYI